MTKIPVLVVVDAGDDFERVRAACESYGLTEVRALPRLGMFKGSIDQAQIAGLTAIPGVASVEPERKVRKY